MNFYPLDFVIEKTLEGRLNREQWLLKQFTGRRLKPDEAAAVWERIVDHKWYVSERLGRDVGFRVAAIDFVDNIYESRTNPRKPGNRRRLGVLSTSNSAVSC